MCLFVRKRQTDAVFVSARVNAAGSREPCASASSSSFPLAPAEKVSLCKHCVRVCVSVPAVCGYRCVFLYVCVHVQCDGLSRTAALLPGK